MHELIESLRGVEVAADDFVVVGFGDMQDKAVKDHDKNLEEFLQWCAAKLTRGIGGAIHRSCGH